MKKKVDPVVDEAIETLNIKDGPSRRRLLEGAGLFSATAAASALIAACTSSSSSSASSTASATSSAIISGGGHNPFPGLPTQQYYFNNHADTNEFFTPTKYGYADAAALLGIPTPIWGGSPSSADSQMVAFMNTAIAAKAAGIATSVIDASMTTPVANAMSAGIPVVTYNSDGIYSSSGVPEIYTNRLAYVGQPLYVAGQAMGEQIKTLLPGGGHIVIFIATPGTGNIQPRIDGAKSVLGSSFTIDEIGTTTTDPTELSTEKAYFLGHKTIKGAFAVDSGSTANLYASLTATGLAKKIPAGGFDTDPRTLAGLKAGVINFSIFQDPYLQGFLPTLYLYMYNLSGTQVRPADTDTSLTVITPSTSAQFVKPSRFQGGSSAELYLPRPSGPISQPVGTTST
jgi:simple sugar transport system substrate-binding protein